MTAREGTQLDQQFDLLAHPYRRHVLHYLSKHTTATDMTTLASEIADRDTEQGKDMTRKDIEIALYHRHLPKLAEANIIDIDYEERTVEYTHTGQLDRFLDEAVHVDDPGWQASGP